MVQPVYFVDRLRKYAPIKINLYPPLATSYIVWKNYLIQTAISCGCVEITEEEYFNMKYFNRPPDWEV